jgi:methylmalonyl-CoA epimerase
MIASALGPHPVSPTIAFRMHHVGVAVRSLGDAQHVYERTLGYRLVDGPYDDPIQKVSVCFLALEQAGEPLVELVAPGSEPSPVANVLAKGVGAYHVCYEVDDLQAAIAQVRAGGGVLVGEPVPAVAFKGRRIAWVYLPTRQLVELLEHRLQAVPQ